MQIFVAGTWNERKAVPFAELGVELGELIASRGYDLSCGPGTGIANYVIRGYKSMDRRGTVRFYLPLRSEMEKVGEVVGPGADKIIETNYDYPLRNIYQIRESDAVFILTGGDGALEEAIVALSDYEMPVAAVTGSGRAVKALEMLQHLFPSWKDSLMVASEISLLMDFIDRRLGQCRQMQ